MALLVRQMALLVGFGLVAAAVLDFVSPHPLSLLEPVVPASASATATCGGHEVAHLAPAPPRMMPLSDALAACASCTAAFVDARGAAAFEEGHIPGAFHLPPEGHPDAGAMLARLESYPTVVVYDADAKGGCRLAQGVADRLVAAGCRDVRVLEGSWTAWEAAQGPAVAGACSACGAGAKAAQSKP